MGDRLTPPEREVVRLLGHGMSQRQIAATLSISVRTVEAHVNHARRKTGASNTFVLRLQAAQAAQNGGEL